MFFYFVNAKLAKTVIDHLNIMEYVVLLLTSMQRYAEFLDVARGRDKRPMKWDNLHSVRPKRLHFVPET